MVLPHSQKMERQVSWQQGFEETRFELFWNWSGTRGNVWVFLSFQQKGKTLTVIMNLNKRFNFFVICFSKPNELKIMMAHQSFGKYYRRKRKNRDNVSSFPWEPTIETFILKRFDEVLEKILIFIELRYEKYFTENKRYAAPRFSEIS